jgi:mRNA-degrading endonuclease toxin of MazEF toxin-antitoxin module
LCFGSFPASGSGEPLTKRLLVVSGQAINQAGMHAIVARLTVKGRDRSVPTAVEVELSVENSLPKLTYVLCHDLVTIRQESLERFGRLGIVDLVRVEGGLRYALSLPR